MLILQQTTLLDVDVLGLCAGKQEVRDVDGRPWAATGWYENAVPECPLERECSNPAGCIVPDAFRLLQVVSKSRNCQNR